MERLDEVFLTSVSKKFLVSPNCSVVASFGIAFVSVNLHLLGSFYRKLESACKLKLHFLRYFFFYDCRAGS